MKISVAAVPYFWSADTYKEFYQALAKTSVDIIYLGETVCSKRRSLKIQDWLEIAQQLKDHGKEVVLSTLTLLEAESELSYLKKIVLQSDYQVEANDMSAVQIASEANRSFTVGSAVNVYNTHTLTKLNQLGMNRWVVPVELGKEELRPIASKAIELNIEVEYQSFGRMPLAFSARCFTARHHQLPKDNCQFKCLEDEQGLLIKTQEGDSFAQINGIQTQSSKVVNLLNRSQELASTNIDIMRVVPLNPADTIEAINKLEESISTLSPDITFENNQNYEYCNGYWLQIEGMKYVQ